MMKATIKNILNVVMLIVLIVSINACDDESENTVVNNLNLKIVPKSGTEILSEGETFTNALGQNYQLDLDKSHIYLSNIRLVKADGTEEPISDVLLFDFDGGSGMLLDVTEGTYTGLKLGLGLDAALNASDPAEFEGDHPLSYTQNTHWSWAAKYKFILLEGNTGNDLSESFAYHLGADALYRDIEITQPIVVGSRSAVFMNIGIDFDKVFENIDFLEEKVTHTNDNMALAEKLISNFEVAFSIQ